MFDALEGTRVGCLLGEPIRRRPVLPGSAPPRPAVPPCAAPSRPVRGMSGFWIRQINMHRHIGQQPGTKSDHRPANKPVSTVCCVPLSVYVGFRFFVLLSLAE